MFTHQMCSYPGAACIRQVLACAKTGCSATPTVLASFLRNPVGLATDGANVYFAERGVTANASDMSTGPMSVLSDSWKGRRQRTFWCAFRWN